MPEKHSLWNKWGIGMQADEIVVLMPPRRLSKDDALTFAAWIVALTGAGDDFQKRLDEICSL